MFTWPDLAMCGFNWNTPPPHMHTDLMNADGMVHREGESERRRDEGYSTALCISDHQLGWFAGVRGVTPVSHSMVKDLLPWQPQSDSLANITARL